MPLTNTEATTFLTIIGHIELINTLSQFSLLTASEAGLLLVLGVKYHLHRGQ